MIGDDDAPPSPFPSPPASGGRGLRRVGEVQAEPTRSWVRGAAPGHSERTGKMSQNETKMQ
jgi:hypothetical protein